jgi:hypothetical protein
MTTDCNYQLTSFEPIVEVLMRLECHADGWTLWTRHRHYAGLFADCPALEIGPLSVSELADVLCADAYSLGARTPGEEAWVRR